MVLEPDPEPGPAGGSGVPLKRRVVAGEPPSVPRSWLRDTDQLDETDNVDRLAADVELNTALALRNYTGPDWDYFEDQLAKYGYAVISVWLGKGLIFARCASRGFGGLPPLPRQLKSDDIDELAGETVAKALVHFRRDVLMKGKWDPTRRASLRTYFIGQCLMRFANIYRSWWVNEMRNPWELADPERQDPGSRRNDPQSRVVDHMTAEWAYSTVRDPRVRRVMLLTVQGVAQADIATELGVTEKAVERMLANERKRLEKRMAG